MLSHQLHVAIAPFRRRQIRPAQAAGGDILAVVSHQAEKGVIGLENRTLEIADEDADDVGVDQAPDLRFALGKVAVQAGILQCARRLRGEQLQNRDTGRREDAGRQVILEIESADALGLIDQGQAENGTRLVLLEVRIGGKRVLYRGIVEKDALAGAQGMVDDRMRQRGRSHGLVAKFHADRIAGGRGFGRDPLLCPARQHQQAALDTGLLNGGPHEDDEQLLPHDCAGHRLRHLDNGRKVELFRRHRERARRPGRGFFLAKVRILLPELPHLAIGSPTNIGVPGVAQIEIGDLVEPSTSIEFGSPFVGDCLILDEATVTRRTDRLFIEAHRVDIAALDARNLRAHQRGAVLEMLRATLRPDLQLPMMGSQSVEVRPSLVGSCGIATGGFGQRTVKAIIRG